jgi:hypothetical protein
MKEKRKEKNSGSWPPDFKIKSFRNQSKGAQQKRKGACI